VDLHEQKPIPPDDTHHKIDNMDEVEHNAKQEDNDIQRAITLSLQDQKDHYEANSSSSNHRGDNRGVKREVEESLSPPRAKFRRSDPAKQMKSPSKSPAKGGGDRGNSNKKITSFFSKD
jgi:Ubiquitin interaction motif